MSDWINEIISEQKREDAYDKFLNVLVGYKNMGYTYEEIEYGVTCLLVNLGTVTSYIFTLWLPEMLNEIFGIDEDYEDES